MRAGANLLLMLTLPVALVVVLAAVILYASLHSVRSQYDSASVAQSDDLRVIHESTSLSSEIGGIQRRMMVSLQGAFSGELDALQLYRMHTQIVNDLDALGRRVEALASSELVREANHNSAARMRTEFETYRRFVIQATDVLAVNPEVASDFLAEAQQHYREFSIFINRVNSLLAERSQLRNASQTEAFEVTIHRLLVISVGGLVLILLLVMLISRRSSRHLLSVARALSDLSKDATGKIAMPEIEQLHRHAKGELGRIAGTLLIFRNAIERQRQAEDEAFQLAFFDPLTRLPNRRQLLDRLRHLLSLGERDNSYSALLQLDLDHFKRINDTRGHAIGDALLVEVAARIRPLLKPSDTLARVSGDDFCILLESIGASHAAAAAQAERVATRILHCIEPPIFLPDEPGHFLTASIGITLFQTDVSGPDEPLQHAEAAMYEAKKAGRNTWRFFDPGVQQLLQDRLELELALRQAIERQQLQLFYQVQVHSQGQTVGVEGLLRWQHPERGRISPAQFIPLAEESGLILPIGQWVLNTACQQLRAWADQPHRSHLSVSVNVSARQFRQASFADEVRQVLETTGAIPRLLKLELTESTVLEDVTATIEKMQQLRALGVRFALDDFGTGYSSLHYLKRLPLDQLKIDQSFVRDIIIDADDAVIVQTIIAMSHAMGMEVIAEGVENETQKSVLREQGCHFYQGYLFGRPVPIDELEHQLDESALH